VRFQARRTYALAVALFLALACGPDGSAVEPPLLITGDSVAGVSVRSSHAVLARVARIVRDTVEEGIEAIPESIAVLVVRGDTLRAVIDSGRVYRLTVTSPRFRTSDSLGVGTSLARLLRLPNAFALTGEGAVWLQAPSHCGIAFHLSDSGTLAEGPDSVGTRQLQTLPASTVAEEIIVVGCATSAPPSPE
jgi:hypothetical protein